jgi:sugar lactone lactonase YvrE
MSQPLPSEVDVAIASDDLLGEGPWWSTHSHTLWRVDINNQRVHRWDPRSDLHKHWPLPDKVGCFVPNADESFGVAALSDGLHWLNLESGVLTRIVELEADLPDNLFNDGKCDRSGNLWVGSKHQRDEGRTGHLYCCDRRGNSRRTLSGIGISNGIGWSPDDTFCYYTDSGQRTIWKMRVGADGVRSREIFVEDTDCFPDGLTVDADGCVWSAKWDGSRVVRYTPDAKIDRIVELPVSRPTSVMFGGDDLTDLYITSARTGVPSEAMAGHVFVYRSRARDIRGIAEVPFDYSPADAIQR